MSLRNIQPTLTVGLNTFGAPPDGRRWRSVLDQARAIEAAGVHRIVVPDHVVNGPDVASYPWGRFPTAPDGDWLEPLTSLATIAAVTEQVRIGTAILIAPLRPAPLLAKTAATLDVLSDGRLDLGVGTGWQPAEFEAFGVDFARRGQLLTDTMRACRALWVGGPTDFRSPSFTLSQVYCAPVPTQARLPIWFSGTLHERNVTRIAELGDGWIPIMGSTPEQAARGSSMLRSAFERCGRDPDTLRIRFTLAAVRNADGSLDAEATIEPVPELAASGVTDVQLNVRAIDPRGEDVERNCARVVDAITRATT